MTDDPIEPFVRLALECMHRQYPNQMSLVLDFGSDHDYPVHLEPGGEDFLSPSVGAADLMTRVLEPEAYAAWLQRAIPNLLDDPWLAPVEPADREDGRLAHLDGLNLSRAWMLGRIASGLPDPDPRVPALRISAAKHGDAGVAALSKITYAGSHWLGTFAAYLLESRSR